MIVEPGFFDHWKTRMLIDTLNDPAAPIYVQRIWEHCQLRRKWVFEVLPPAALKALCRYNGHANQLESALVASGFVRRDDDGTLTALKWDKYNASLVANWDNGAKGGRPPKGEKKPIDNPPITHGLPMANPWGNPRITDREEKIEKTEKKPPKAPQGGLVVDFPAGLQGEPFRKAWDSWVAYRREKGKRLTPSTIAKQLADLAKYGEALAVASIEESITKGWTGLFPETAKATPKAPPPRILDENATAARQWLQEQSYGVRERIVQQYRTASGGSTASTEDILKVMAPKLVALVNEYRQKGAA